MPPPPWIEPLRDRGPFARAALALIERVGGDELPRGAPGVARLARWIDAHAERDTVTPSEESAFVEGAGSLLACLLIDHLGNAAHATRDGAHRLRVGARGFFDPFAAIEAALDAPDARRSLAHSIARAEDEAHERRGVGRAARLFERALERERPELSVVDRFVHRLWLAPLDVEVDLSRALEIEDDERALAIAIDKLVAMIPGAAREASALSMDELRQRLLPRLVAADFAPAPRLFLRPIAHGVRIALVLAYDGKSRFVTVDELDARSLAGGDALAIALTNLAARSATARATEPDAHGVIALESRDGLDSARLLLPGLHDALAALLGSPFLAAAPHRDTLLAAPLAARDALTARALDAAMRAPHRISERLFLVGATGLAEG